MLAGPNPGPGSLARTSGPAPRSSRCRPGVARRTVGSVTGASPSVTSGSAGRGPGTGGRPDRRAGGDQGAVRVGEPQAAHARDEVLGHAGDEQVDLAAPAAAIAARSLVGLDPVDEGTREQLVDGERDRLRGIDLRGAVPERGSADDASPRRCPGCPGPARRRSCPRSAAERWDRSRPQDSRCGVPIGG